MGLGEFYSIACAMAWAVAVILFKRSGESLGPFALNLFKNLLALAMFALTLAVLPSATWPDFPADAWVLMLVSGLIGIGIGDTLYFQALNRIGAARVGIAGMLYSPFVIVLSMLFLGERLAMQQWLGVLAVLAGVVLVNRPDRAAPVVGREGLIGLGFAAGAIALMAIGIVIAKPLLQTYDFLWVVSVRLAGGVIGMLVVVAVRRNAGTLWRAYRHVRHWPSILIGSVMGTYVAMLLWLAGYKYTLASVAAVLNETAAVFILILAAIFLKDRLRGVQLLGTAVAAGGVALVVWPSAI